jgi:hypothetical protein
MINPGEGTQEVELVGQNALDILAAKRADLVFFGRSGVEPSTDLRVLFRGKRQTGFATAQVIESC